MIQSKKFRYLYGPVSSWRLGRSLGIDPISDKEKICNYDCVYCQLGRTAKFFTERKEYVRTDDIVSEIKSLPDVAIDYLTFSGRGEPTLALNLGEMIRQLREIRNEKIALITNSALFNDEDVRRDAAMADFVLAKLDAATESAFERVDIAAKGIHLKEVIEGLKVFRQEFKGRMALQIMLIAENKNDAPNLAALARDINADVVELNTPTRPCGVPMLSHNEMEEIKRFFDKLPVVCVYDVEPPMILPAMDTAAAVQRHGNFLKPRR